MITPLLPIFLTATLGAGPAIVGLVEGVAEATASLLKLVSGRLLDRFLAYAAALASTEGHLEKPFEVPVRPMEGTPPNRVSD